MRHFWSVLALSAIVALPAAADQLDDEIIQRVVNPCISYVIELEGELSFLTTEEVVTFVKIQNRTVVSDTLAVVRPLITPTMNAQDRQATYDLALKVCKRSAQGH